MPRADEFLEEKGVWYKLIELGEAAYTAADVERLTGGEVKENEIYKTIIVKADGVYKAIVLHGNDKFDYKKIGKKVRMATADEVKEFARCVPGAVCPFFCKCDIIIDPKLFDNEKVNFGSGDLHYGIEVKTADLPNILTYEELDVVKE